MDVKKPVAVRASQTKSALNLAFAAFIAAEIIEDLQAALDEFALIYADLAER